MIELNKYKLNTKKITKFLDKQFVFPKTHHTNFLITLCVPFLAP